MGLLGKNMKWTSAGSDQKADEEMTLKCTLTKLKPGVGSGIHMGGVVTFLLYF